MRAPLRALAPAALACLLLASLGQAADAQSIRMPNDREIDAERVRDVIRMPTDKQIEAQRGRMPTESELVERRRKNPRLFEMPSEADLAKQPAPVLPRVDDARGIDAGALAQRYEEALRSGRMERAQAARSGLLVFVTLAMPDAALARLAAQAEQAQATLLIRGLQHRSMRATAQRAAKIIGERRVAWLIDPHAFKRFEVRVAPSFVLTRRTAGSDCASGECPRDNGYAMVAGDVSLDYALQAIERGDPEFAPLAREYLTRLR